MATFWAPISAQRNYEGNLGELFAQNGCLSVRKEKRLAVNNPYCTRGEIWCMSSNEMESGWRSFGENSDSVQKLQHRYIIRASLIN